MYTRCKRWHVYIGHKCEQKENKSAVMTLTEICLIGNVTELTSRFPETIWLIFISVAHVYFKNADRSLPACLTYHKKGVPCVNYLHSKIKNKWKHVIAHKKSPEKRRIFCTCGSQLILGWKYWGILYCVLGQNGSGSDHSEKIHNPEDLLGCNVHQGVHLDWNVHVRAT